MCGRFAITLPHDAMAQLFAALPGNDLPEGPSYNVCPTTQIAVISAEDGIRRLRAMRWGLVPHWAKSASDGPLLINARSETIAEKPAFRDAARHRRCLIPASGFYEWTKDPDGARLPWYIAATDGAPLAFAGVWQDWRDAPTAAILTCAANEAIAAIHPRMPVILAPQDWALWLGEAGPGASALMRPAPEDALRAHRVDPAVNGNRARGEGLIAPLNPA